MRITPRLSRIVALPIAFGILLGLTRPTVADRPEVELEKLIGQQVAGALREGSGVDTDPLLADWVRRIGDKVATASSRKDIPCTFEILATDAANALAVPGGNIFVTRGMLDAIESDDELAVVLAHEVGHHTKKHGMRQIAANALFVLGINFVDGKNSRQIRNGLVVLNVLYTLARSREFEAQADDLGLQFASLTGYDPMGLVEFFEGFDLRRRSRLEEYFATHPSPKNRLEFARRSPLVTRQDPAQREAMAKAFETRGLPGTAAAARAGADTLSLPPIEPYTIPDYLKEERDQVAARAEKVRKSLEGTYQTQRYGSTLQTLMLINNQSDLRWLIIASRAYAVQTRVDDLLARTVRVAKTTAPTYDALAAYSGRGGVTSQEAIQGRAEVRKALQRIEGAPTPLLRASRAVATVLTDLNNRFLKLGPTETWLRYGALEALLQYAISELGRADEMSGVSWRQLSLARIRRYQLCLTDLVPEGDIARRSRWYDLTQRRFGRAFDGSGPAGDATVRAALGVELSESDELVSRGREDTAWTDWVLEKHGIPENIATALRLLTFDLEREFVFEKRYAGN